MTSNGAAKTRTFSPNSTDSPARLKTHKTNRLPQLLRNLSDRHHLTQNIISFQRSRAHPCSTRSGSESRWLSHPTVESIKASRLGACLALARLLLFPEIRFIRGKSRLTTRTPSFSTNRRLVSTILSTKPNSCRS